jgi:hypothetical protein
MYCAKLAVAAARIDKREIQVAIQFLTWLDTENTRLADTTQEQIDRWLTENPNKRQEFSTFIRWVVVRKLTGQLTVKLSSSPMASLFLDDQEYRQQLHRCLTDDSLPLEVRVVGALIRLYALPLTRILELTTDKFTCDADNAYLTIDRHPVLLPPTLADIITRLIAKGGHAGLRRVPGQPNYLLPGRPPSRPRSSSALTQLMSRHGLPGLRARNTAMIEATSDLPATVVSDLFGIHPATAHNWAQYAQNSWTDYLAADKNPP